MFTVTSTQSKDFYTQGQQ